MTKINQKINSYNETAITLPIKTEEKEQTKKFERKLGDEIIENGINILNFFA